MNRVKSQTFDGSRELAFAARSRWLRYVAVDATQARRTAAFDDCDAIAVMCQQPRGGDRMQPTAQSVGTCPRNLQPASRGRNRLMPHSLGNILLHIIFSTHERRPLIRSEYRGDLFAYLGGIVREMRATALIINGTADHVHILSRIRPAHSAAEIVRIVKTNSSRWMHDKRCADFSWQTGYGAFSVSESNVAAVTKYIAEQEEHHKKVSFQEEFVAFLKKNHVAYDERYIWR